MRYPITMTQADVLAWAAAYDGPRFHGLLSDPPYHLTEITRRFGASNAAPAQFGSDGAFQRAGRGFMGQTWDGGDIAFRPETWEALSAHLHPGAFGMAFASSRGWHRMAVAIEDAGLIIHPVILCWGFGSGFPKATKPADQYVAGKLRQWLIERPDALAELRAAQLAVRQAPEGATAAVRTTYQETKRRLLEAAGLVHVIGQHSNPASMNDALAMNRGGWTAAPDVVEYLDPVAKALAGHRYGLQALKPALEPIIVFQKPYEGRAIDDIVATGAGVLNIDGARIGVERLPGQRAGQAQIGTFERHDMVTPERDGRWPANLALVHHPACDEESCAADCPVERIDRQSGRSKSTNRIGHRPGKQTGIYSAFAGQSQVVMGHADTGTAARYFYNTDWMHERMEAADQVGYFAKASRAEREAGLDPLQLALMRAIANEGDEGDESFDLPDFDLTLVDDGRQTPIDNPYQRGETERRNTHPTIKPLSLTRWLATLLLPPDLWAPRRLLVPFAGTGSEAVGGMLAGWDEIEGIELGEAHVQIAHARIAYWHQRRHQLMGGQSITTKATRQKKGTPVTRSLFDAIADEEVA